MSYYKKFKKYVTARKTSIPPPYRESILEHLKLPLLNISTICQKIQLLVILAP